MNCSLICLIRSKPEQMEGEEYLISGKKVSYDLACLVRHI